MDLSSEESDTSENENSPSTSTKIPKKIIPKSSPLFRQTLSRPPDPSDAESSSGSGFESVDEEPAADSAALLALVMKNLEEAKKAEAALMEKNSKDAESDGSLGAAPGKKEKKALSEEIAQLLLRAEPASSLGSGAVEAEETPEKKYEIPKEGVKITLAGEAANMFRRRNKRCEDLADTIRKRMNRRLRSEQIFLHKTSLLCWLAYGFCLNGAINDPEVLSTALSLVPSGAYPKGRADLKYLEQFTKWFKNFVKIEFSNSQQDRIDRKNLLAALASRRVGHLRDLVLLYVAALRAIGLRCRLVVSLTPVGLKPRSDELFQPPKTAKTEGNLPHKIEKKKQAPAGPKKGGKFEKLAKNLEDCGKKKIVPENSGESLANAKIEAKKRAAQVLTKFANTKSKKSIKPVSVEKHSGEQIGDSAEKDFPAKSPPLTRLRSRAGNSRPMSSAQASKQPENVVQEPEKSSGKKKRATKSAAPSASQDPESDGEKYSGKKMENKKKEDDIWMDDSTGSEEEFEPKPAPRRQKVNSKKKKKSAVDKSLNARDSIDRRVFSSDEGEPETIDAKDAQNIWVEVYLESEESWVTVSVPDDKIHCVDEIYKKAPKPVLYVVAWNAEGTLKDVTRRYCPHWLTVTRKKRVDENWWLETLGPWSEKKTVLSKAEDEMLLQREMEQPLPKTVGECKGHPLYVLIRHLLKFEALHPPECVPLGHLPNGEAIYSRHCVHTLCSRETWIKKARVVKPAQEAYKIVKAMPKFDKLSGIKLKDQPLELFGKWQTTQYVPPEAKDGIVPRNEYGNVDLFKQCMLPKGTVHINLPALNRVARKLKIDCVPAVVGFNFGARGALPAFEGFVVCEEFEDVLREAWEVEEVESMKRAVEKREKRIYGNWKKLIKGLFIRERLAARYDFRDEKDEESTKKASSTAKGNKRKAPEVKKVGGKKTKKL